jgi:hypothetical protein
LSGNIASCRRKDATYVVDAWSNWGEAREGKSPEGTTRQRIMVAIEKLQAEKPEPGERVQ